MVTRLAEAIARIQELNEAAQEHWAEWILAELESEKRWDERTGNSQDLLEEMADRALAEERAGLTEELTEAEYRIPSTSRVAARGRAAASLRSVRRVRERPVPWWPPVQAGWRPAQHLVSSSRAALPRCRAA